MSSGAGMRLYRHVLAPQRLQQLPAAVQGLQELLPAACALCWDLLDAGVVSAARGVQASAVVCGAMMSALQLACATPAAAVGASLLQQWLLPA